MMTDAAEFERRMQQLGTAIRLGSDFPNQVFEPTYGRFAFFHFDDLFDVGFWNLLQDLAASSHDQSVNLCIPVGDPKKYFKEQGFFPIRELPTTATTGEFKDCLHRDIFIMDLVWFPPSMRWAVWGTRDCELAVLAYHEDASVLEDRYFEPAGTSMLAPEEAMAATAGLWWGVPERKLLFATELMKNYGDGRPWIDVAAQRAVVRIRAIAQDILGDRLTILEGCRLLADRKWEAPATLQIHFAVFEGISDQARSLPIGAVRTHWSPEVLKVKDVEIRRMEQYYRTTVRDACKKLIAAMNNFTFDDK